MATESEVRRAWVRYVDDGEMSAPELEFDAWLAEEVRKAKENAWSECMAAHNLARIQAFYNGGDPVVAPNPYRKE